MPEAGRDIASAFWAPQAWVTGRWQQDVLLRAGADGRWISVQSGVQASAASASGATILQGPILPGLVNAHSHAFQRAFAGLAERRGVNQDDFWSWRDRMYRVALRVSPEQQYAIAAQLFLELLRGGYTQVCEFHYLHNAEDGTAYAPDAVRLARSIQRAAHDVGIGLTMLPCVYERAGFQRPALSEDQRRFRADAAQVLAMRDALRESAQADGTAHGANGGPVRVGLAVHSLRAVTPQAIDAILAGADDAPIHVHAAEQTQEVDDCLAATGLRPIEWLCRHGRLDARWQLVHATHATPSEIESLARTGAGVVLCPSTEANLGDGVTDLPAWLKHEVPIAIGTDSHVARSALEEIRLLETSQRLLRQVRCIGAAPQDGEVSTAHRLWSRVLAGGAQAAGASSWGLVAGARADLLVVDLDSPSLLGIPPSHVLDALVFSSPVRPFRDILVAGRWATREHRSALGAQAAAQFASAMHVLWSASPPT